MCPRGYKRDDDEGVNDCGDIKHFVVLNHTDTRPDGHERDDNDDIDDGRND